MPPRYAYWTIVIDDAPTAFRARDRADLMPTFRQLANRNPNAAIRWFANGRLWGSPEEARAAARRRGHPSAAAARGATPAQGVVSVPNHAGGPAQDPPVRFRKRGPKRVRKE